MFNQPVDNLPPNLTHLEFGILFNHSVNNLPSNLTVLTFGYVFNQPVDNLPIHIKQIKVTDKLKIDYLKKIPFGCKITDEYDNEIFYENH